jgi:hypothetical protein
MKKTLFIFGPYDEFTLFIKFNSAIRREKQKKEYDEIIAIVPYCAAGVLSEADKILTVPHEFHVKTNTHYPAILDPHLTDPDLVPIGMDEDEVVRIMREDLDDRVVARRTIVAPGHTSWGGMQGEVVVNLVPGWRGHEGYVYSGFMKIVLQYIEKYFDNYDIAMYSHGSDDEGIVHNFHGEPSILTLLPNNVKFIDAFDVKRNPNTQEYSREFITPHTRSHLMKIDVPCSDVYHDQFADVGENLRQGMKLLPFKEDYDAMKDKFGTALNKKTYVIHSRGFINKQPNVYNADVGVDKLGYREVLKKLMDEGYKFLNIGFPPAKLDFDHYNYAAINIDLSYSEYLAICRLTAGWAMFSDAGGWLIHICSDLDIFSLGSEWSHFGTETCGYKPLLENRLSRKDLYTADLRNTTPEALYESIKAHKPTIYSDNLPSLKERVIIVDE